jgi:hypothetical protein
VCRRPRAPFPAHLAPRQPPSHIPACYCRLSPPLPSSPLCHRDLWRITTFLRETGFQADLAACRAAFPDLLTFDQFLAASQWGDVGRTYEQGIVFDGPLPPPSSSSSSRKGVPLAAGRK